MRCFDLLLVLSLFFICGCASKSRVLLVNGYPDGDWQAAPPEGTQLQPSPFTSGRLCALIKGGEWQSPPFPVVELEFYRIRFRSKAEGRGYWSFQFYDRDGKHLVADHYSSVDATSEWVDTDCCVRASARAHTARVTFRPQDGKAMTIADVSVRKAARKEVAPWADAVYAGLPPVEFIASADRWRCIPKAMERLRNGGTLRVVVLGDSIASDMSTSPWDVILERLYPGCRVQVIVSVQGGAGCQYYKQENRVRQYVVDFNPDLLIIAGISHGYDAESIRTVIRQVRESIDPEIMVMTGAVSPGENATKAYAQWFKVSEEVAKTNIERFAAGLRAIAQDERIELFDIRAAWDSYVASCARPAEWFMRDVIHANTRGRQALARILERYFAPKERMAPVEGRARAEYGCKQGRPSPQTLRCLPSNLERARGWMCYVKRTGER